MHATNSIGLNNIYKANTTSVLQKYRIFSIGLNNDLSPYLYAQGFVFNILNTTGLAIVILRFLYLAFFSAKNNDWFLVTANFLPIIACLAMIWMMYRRAYITTVYFSFCVFPVLMMFLGFYTDDRGIFFFLFPYMVYTFFFLNSKRKIIPVYLMLTLFFMIAFFTEATSLIRKEHQHEIILEVLGAIGSMLLLFVSLYSIKFQVWSYQEQIKKQKKELQESKLQIEAQKEKLEELNAVKDKVFSVISHDLNTPIQQLRNLFEQADKEILTAENLPVITDSIKKELKKTSELFENLLNWSKLQMKEASVQHEKINISELVFKVLDSLSGVASRKGIRLNNTTANFYIDGDKDILEIVLRNVVSNAIKFSSSGDTVYVGGTGSENAFEIRVVDTGTGISKEALEKIEEKNFYTTRGTGDEKGTGLGLLICKDLLAKCNGSLTIQSEAGKGTTVILSIPQH